MSIPKFALKLLGTHALMTVVQFFLYLILFGIFVDSAIYQWFMGIFFIALFWLVVYADVSHAGQNDLKREVYSASRTVIAACWAALPGIVLYAAHYFYEPLVIALRLWQIPYIKIFVTLDAIRPDWVPHAALIAILLFPAGVLLCYLDGPRRRKKILAAIEKSEALRAEKSKRNT